MRHGPQGQQGGARPAGPAPLASSERNLSSHLPKRNASQLALYQCFRPLSTDDAKQAQTQTLDLVDTGRDNFLFRTEHENVRNECREICSVRNKVLSCKMQPGIDGE